jgi:molybdopterin-guanine dinucleotide biosynthesis protein MobB
MEYMVCIFQLVGQSGVGKTHVIEEATRRLKESGKTVTILKHSHHELDVKGKDTWRFRQNGADLIAFASPKSTVIFTTMDPKLLISIVPTDVVFVEGWSEIQLGYRIEVKGEDMWNEVISRIVNEGSQCSRVRRVRVNGKLTNSKGLLGLVTGIMESLGITSISLD